MLPRVFVGEHDREGEERVQPHARGEPDRVIGVKPHDQGAGRCRKAGGDEDRALVHAGIAEDGRVDEHDVDHRQEGGGASDEFGADVGAVLAKPELTFEKAAGSRCRIAHVIPQA